MSHKYSCTQYSCTRKKNDLESILDCGLDLADAQAGTFVVDSRFFLPALASQRDVLDQAIEEHGKQRKAVLRSVQRLKDFLELWKNEIQVRDGDLGAMEEARG